MLGEKSKFNRFELRFRDCPLQGQHASEQEYAIEPVSQGPQVYLREPSIRGVDRQPWFDEQGIPQQSQQTAQVARRIQKYGSASEELPVWVYHFCRSGAV